jgi:hypothetical protein
MDPSEVPVPDGIDPITAFRAWRVDSDLRLHSPNVETEWVPGEWLVAKCERTGHTAPSEGCSCGVYAAKDIQIVLRLAAVVPLLANRLHDGVAVIGRVWLAGKVIEHDDGYRAQCARVSQILPVSGSRQQAEDVATRFGVPLGEEIPAEAIPDLGIPADFVGIPGCIYMGPVEPPEPTIPGRLLLLAASLFFAVIAMRGLWENQRLDWSDWFLCLIVVASAIGVWRAIVMLPRALRGPPASGQEPSTESLDERTALVPDSPRPYGGERQ